MKWSDSEQSNIFILWPIYWLPITSYVLAFVLWRLGNHCYFSSVPWWRVTGYGWSVYFTQRMRSFSATINASVIQPPDSAYVFLGSYKKKNGQLTTNLNGQYALRWLPVMIFDYTFIKIWTRLSELNDPSSIYILWNQENHWLTTSAPHFLPFRDYDKFLSLIALALQG